MEIHQLLNRNSIIILFTQQQLPQYLPLHTLQVIQHQFIRQVIIQATLTQQAHVQLFHLELITTRILHIHMVILQDIRMTNIPQALTQLLPHQYPNLIPGLFLATNSKSNNSM